MLPEFDISSRLFIPPSVPVFCSYAISLIIIIVRYAKSEI